MNKKNYTFTKFGSKQDTCIKKMFVLFTEREQFLENQVNKLTQEVKSIKGI